ncbi:type II toxin-antitoxin system HicA family toxin [Streptomyces sp. NPDC058740]|uniref:type II toxin-antitoxin system HicA family toxin n=1 Tax=Streptomyces sp. NPDC058740 TaxID=3346619 RepID=UPI0036839BED
MSSKEVRQLIKKLQAQGFEVSRTKSSHWLVKKGGTRVTTLPGSPSDPHSLKNCVAALKRHGYTP